ncbi:NAD(P)/FAD-dependent oxidoreductase [Nitratifractor salsuginis]|uniref:FAD-dependent pyridine nucleotide-disulfide oxidoreductase n=1 Tax=Nitratifractor salsuginis (strain DSM 16511 / JCM 12458 / E9I37-1) TaxID=749222 RepID=E6X3A7_NITSE|nr:FAD-dependent oxidoreductase [Nitratifractor salsuginis]ADV47320.1 FAD-dependent pyridine nucleotide-disulfide oxidoreductase [Nitratifractor salsuginis DSM 16511]
MDKKDKKVLVLGGGFAGIETAIFLRKKGYPVTLVSDRDYFYIYPTSIWIPTGEAKFEDIAVPLKDLQKAHGFELVIDRITEIRSKEHKAIGEKGEYSGDYLVIAIGSGKVKHEGNEHFLSICGKPEESLQIKERLDALIAKGSGKIAMGFGGNPKDPSNVRGGPAFEVLFNVHNRLKKLGIRQNFELTFFAPMKEPGARMGPQALKMMGVFFKKLDIHTHFGKKIQRFEADGIVFEDESKLESDFTMFIPAGNGHPVFQNSDLPLNEAGLIRINDYCEVQHNFDDIPERYNVFAIGDSAAIDGPDWRAKQGHIAEVMARNVAFNIDAIEQGREERKGYLEHLNILCVMDTGDGAAFVYRDNKGGKMVPMPVIGHWLKKGWGWYCRNSKLGKIPRIPGM